MDFLGVVTGGPADALTAALKPFESAADVDVKYKATFSQQSILQTRIQAGNPPDVVFSAYPRQLVTLAKAGKLVPLNNVVNMQAVRKQYPKPLLDLGSIGSKLYAYFSIVNYHALVWFNTTKYTGPRAPTWAQLQAWTKRSAQQGRPPWCLGIESGAATGWPAADELLDALFVRRYGPKLAAQWEAGKLKWTSPKVRWAWRQVGAIFTESDDGHRRGARSREHELPRSRKRHVHQSAELLPALTGAVGTALLPRPLLGSERFHPSATSGSPASRRPSRTSRWSMETRSPCFEITRRRGPSSRTWRRLSSRPCSRPAGSSSSQIPQWLLSIYPTPAARGLVQRLVKSLKNWFVTGSLNITDGSRIVDDFAAFDFTSRCTRPRAAGVG